MDGPGETVKMFLYTTILATIYSQEKTTLVVGSSGVASTLLPSGRTAHSQFKILININDDQGCFMARQGCLVGLFCRTDVICWYEAPMAHR